MSSWLGRTADAAWQAGGRIVTDIRQRVVEEGIYGKIVTPRATSITLGSPGEKSPGDALGWTLPGETQERGTVPGWFQRDFSPDPSRQAEPHDRDIHGNERDQGMER